MNYLHEFVLHAALDNIDEAIWTTQSCYLKAVDRYYDLTVSAYTTSSLVKFLLLHDSKNDDGIRSFFHDLHEYYIKVRPPPLSLPACLEVPSTHPPSSPSPFVRGHGFLSLSACLSPARVCMFVADLLPLSLVLHRSC